MDDEAISPNPNYKDCFAPISSGLAMTKNILFQSSLYRSLKLECKHLA